MRARACLMDYFNAHHRSRPWRFELGHRRGDLHVRVQVRIPQRPSGRLWTMRSARPRPRSPTEKCRQFFCIPAMGDRPLQGFNRPTAGSTNLGERLGPTGICCSCLCYILRRHRSHRRPPHIYGLTARKSTAARRKVAVRMVVFAAVALPVLRWQEMPASASWEYRFRHFE